MAQATISAKRPARGAGLRRWLLPWTAGFQPSWIGRDLVAGIALGVVMIPQGMAYAELAGMPGWTARSGRTGFSPPSTPRSKRT